jgi:hypothetical protein
VAERPALSFFLAFIRIDSFIQYHPFCLRCPGFPGVASAGVLIPRFGALDLESVKQDGWPVFAVTERTGNG